MMFFDISTSLSIRKQTWDFNGILLFAKYVGKFYIHSLMFINDKYVYEYLSSVEGEEERH